jgi:hypothetical protein
VPPLDAPLAPLVHPFRNCRSDPGGLGQVRDPFRVAYDRVFHFTYPLFERA